MPLHPLELALVVVASAQLCFLPWALGGREPWAQVLSFVLGLIALGVALVPRVYDGELAPQGGFVLHPWPRLLRFPIFWLGLLFLGYVACQALNPAYTRTAAGSYWWLVPQAHVEWLPSGVEAPFAKMNAWRMLTIWGGAWALGCALWIGLTRRLAAQAVLNAIIINGALLALIGILQKVTGAEKILWFITPVTRSFVATFTYENFAGAYFNIVIALTVAMMAWHHLRALRRLDRSSPAPVFAFGVIVLAALVFLSNSRAGMALLVAFFLVGSLLYLFWRLRAKEGGAHPVVTGLLACAGAALIATTVWYLNLDKGFDQIRTLALNQGQDGSMQFRVKAREATLELFEASPVQGWGAGSFRHVFPLTQKNYPEIHRVGRRTLFWDHAHNDYVQALAELGVVGFSMPVLMLGWLLFRALRQGMLLRPPFVLGFLGLGMPLAHGWMDFPLYNCAIFVTVCAGFVLLARWQELEANR